MSAAVGLQAAASEIPSKLERVNSEIAEVKHEVARLEQQLDGAADGEQLQLILRGEKLALQQRLTGLQHEKLLLMRQQDGTAAHSAAAESRPATLKEIKEVAQEIKEVAQEIKEAVAPVQVLVCALYSSQHWAPASSTGSAKQKFRPVALSAYGAMDGDKTWCVVTGMWWPAVAAQVGKDTVVYVRNAHIFARRSNTGLQQMEWRTMGLGSSPDVVENVLPMMASVEAAFDNQRMCVLPVMDAQGVRFMIHILESTLKDQLVYGSWFSTARRDYPEWTAPDARLRVREGLGAVAPQALRFGQLDKQQLVFKTAQRPATRCLMHHAFWALQRAKEEGWDTRGLDIPRDHFGWQSPTVQDRMEATGLWVYGPHGAAGDGQ